MSELRKTFIEALVIMLLMSVGAPLVYGSGTYLPGDGASINNNTSDVLNTSQNQYQTTYGPGYSSALGGASYSEGGDAYGGDSDAYSYSGGSNPVAVSNISTTSISEYESKVPPISVIPPYLPYWTHGGWGIVKAYFPNGPSVYDSVYERTFNPGDPGDMKELKKILRALPYSSPLNLLGGVFNGVRVVFGGPDYFHRGRGFEISNALIRERRPHKKPLLVFIDSNVSRELLQSAGYAYVGRVSLEGDVDRNWDQVYGASVAEALPWDVDILLIAGGMKGVTVGSSQSFPGAAGAYSQTSYSLSFLGAMSGGITEGKGKAMVSVEGFRFWPQALTKRGIPRAIYDRIHVKPVAQAQEETTAEQQAPPAAAAAVQKQPGVQVSRELYDLAGFEAGRSVQNLMVH